ncbi:Gfo/Idh/MocA family oxidoreductase [Chitinophagaceae bacterium LB-8]|uniref:Gfo/Idh/MocA family oxidoreductase n=1 Tax=Paraflavisolibacter caeni TaxID=2982496 RepID=A0A9X2XVN1_9BACT|nr:Gfo/Idh/MocA family oxidoreductase [Paraflavisolibacter caeni]MCU7549670.1 Gfo/Idh/MocA family oxidoreductase [Paraflavisolibacter caeni]
MSFYSPLPQRPRPIFIIGAGGIVNDAHLPAYQLASFPVAGIFDINRDKAEATAQKFAIPRVFGSLEEMIQHAPKEVVFDVALPGSAMIGVMEQLPNGTAVLLQKPMGEDLSQAKQILQLSKDKELTAGINFQLRYAPNIKMARDLINQGLLGELCDIEVNINVFTPWHIWEFMYGLPRVEILYHSIHHIDLIRSFLGNPKSIYAKTVKHPVMNKLASVRSNIIMDYGDMIRANILTNHCHVFGLDKQQSYIKFEGTKGAIKITLGVLMDYPIGMPDKFEYVFLEEGKKAEWKELDIKGGWFPHAFIGSMAQVMLAADGLVDKADNSVDDCIHTMACVEAAYESSELGGVSLSKFNTK